jgi:RNA polymerase-associated protein CTR9
MRQYESAETFFKGRNVPNLLYLSRTWYDFANRSSNYSAMGKALSYAQKVSLVPIDRVRG